MLEKHRQRLQRIAPQTVFLPGHPIFEIAYWILSDQRVIPNHPGLFTLRSFKVYGVALWKARWLWNRRNENPRYVLRHIADRTDMLQYIPGRYEKTTFLQPEDQSYRGLFDDNTFGEISSNEVDGCSLTEVLERLDAFAFAYEQRMAAQKLAQKAAADERRAEFDRKMNEKADRKHRQRARKRILSKGTTTSKNRPSPLRLPLQSGEIGASQSCKPAPASSSTDHVQDDTQGIEMATEIPATNEDLAKGAVDGGRPLRITTARVTASGNTRSQVSESGHISAKGIRHHLSSR